MIESVASIGGVDIDELHNMGTTPAGPWAVALADGTTYLGSGDDITARIREDAATARERRYATMPDDEFQDSDYGRGKFGIWPVLILTFAVVFFSAVVYFAAGGQ